MKVRKETERMFIPIHIVLETQQEVEEFYKALLSSAGLAPLYHSSLVRDIIHKLDNMPR